MDSRKQGIKPGWRSFTTTSAASISWKNTAESLAYAQRALTIRKELGQLKEEVSVLRNMSLIYEQNGQPDLALRTMRESLRLSEQADDGRDLAKGWAIMGEVLPKQGATDSALFYLEKALALQKESGAGDELASTQNVMALLLNEMGRPEEAIALSLQAFRWGEEAGKNDPAHGVRSALPGL